MYAEEDYLMLSGIQHFAFCKRQWAMIHIEQQWAENYRTTAGEIMHKKAHDESAFEKRGNLLTVRGLRISSRSLGLSGQCDVVEFHQDENGIDLFGYEGKWNIVPVEYKRGTVKENNADELQLCAQAVCLEEMFQMDIPEGFLYYGENRRRHQVEFTSELRSEVERTADKMHEMFRRGHTPGAKPSKQCKSCSLENLCLPKLQKSGDVRKYIEKNIYGGE
ncbi:CRISPR-associated protein Cas4 [Roseburia sp. 1XD42-69]|uniref:CRISPR-associated protein Cas4 n=1 Tax=Roseburia sp. 1XD42-69 TaxID=2320088 RepID=UPI000EA2AFA2|nr:CRISPR-associated protein Cas4 [Roseburia sp. 1XD42-69]MCX4320693.1 CRISPR-associated protein Cas4 [Lachnospiraceae bacterium]RKJ63705.1 CRISPR-associated protein Cas4 [Roseburia sp. 1XD42-69]